MFISHCLLFVFFDSFFVGVLILGILRNRNVNHHDVTRHRDICSRVGQCEALLHHVIEVLLDMGTTVQTRSEGISHDHVHVQAAEHHHVILGELLARSCLLRKDDEEREVEHFLVNIQ